MSQTSLRQQLVLPFVILVVFVSCSIGWISFRAGEDAVEVLTRRLLIDVVDRIDASTDQHLAGALIALESISPDPTTVPRAQPFSADLRVLEERFWAASGLFMEVSNYVYFGGADGQFIGVNRVKRDFVELHIGQAGSSERKVYAVQAPGDRGTLLRHYRYDARTRPWYNAAAHHVGPVWSEVYNDYRSNEPVITLAKSVYHADLSLAGVLATDVRLKTLTDYLRALTVSQHGVAFVMESTGAMIATSGDEPPVRLVDGVVRRMQANAMRSPLIRESTARVLDWRNNLGNPGMPRTASFSYDGERMELAAAHLGQKYGVDWISVVVVPRADFMSGVTRGVIQSLLIALVCIGIALVLGLRVLNRLLQDVKTLSNAARKIGDGEILPKLAIERTDEIGLLASTFNEMEHKLRTDRLTQVCNRESFHAQVERLRQQAASEPDIGLKFGVMFIDLDHFKTVNDQLGHAAGDLVLIEVAARLRAAVIATDVVARYGGDEFVLLLKGASSTREMTEMEHHVRAVAEQPILMDGQGVRVGLSIGWALYPDDGADARALLKVADARMFGVKHDRRASRR